MEKKIIKRGQNRCRKKGESKIVSALGRRREKEKKEKESKKKKKRGEKT